MFYDHEPPRGHCRRSWTFWAGRHHGGRGFGPFAGFFGGAGRGGGEFRTGRKLAAAELHLVVLALLAEQPRHGYELIKALDERSGGFYVPSPGVIYPALTYLEEIGYATVEADGAKKLYSITPAGQAHLAENRAAVDAILAELDRIGAKMGNVRRAFAGEEPASAEDDAYGRGGSEELHAARHALRAALHTKRRLTAEEAARIAAILRRAAAEILGG